RNRGTEASHSLPRSLACPGACAANAPRPQPSIRGKTHPYRPSRRGTFPDGGDLSHVRIERRVKVGTASNPRLRLLVAGVIENGSKELVSEDCDREHDVPEFGVGELDLFPFPKNLV